MELSSPRFKAITVTVGFSLWFFVITTALKIFSVELFVIFMLTTVIVTQVFARKVSRVLDAFAIINTKIFLGALFIFVMIPYGILFKFLRIDLLRLKKKPDTYWLEMEGLNRDGIFKQY
jgi:hypothetical protein